MAGLIEERFLLPMALHMEWTAFRT